MKLTPIEGISVGLLIIILLALSLRGGSGSVSTVTQTVTVSNVTIQSTDYSGAGGVDTITLYGIAAIAVIFIVATGYLAMRGRPPLP